MRFGILSTAAIGTDYLVPAIQASSHTVAAIGSRDGERARDVADDLGVERAHGSYEALLADDDIDAVYNPLPNALHAEWTRRAADQGLHVLCEKPLTADAEAAADLFDYCESRDVTLMEAFMYRYHPRTERVLEILDEELGAVRHLEATFTFDIGDRTDDIRLDPDLAGGSLMDVGCYAVNFARTVLGEPERAYAHSADRFDCGVDTRLTGLLEYPDDVTAQVTGGFDSPDTDQYRVLTGDGWLEAKRTFGANPGEVVEITHAVDGERTTETFDPVDHYRLEVEGFAEAVETGAKPRITREDTVGNMRTIDALAASAASGEPVDLE